MCASSATFAIATTQTPATAPTRIATATCERAFERTNARRAAVEAASERLGRIVIAGRVSPSCLDLWTIRRRARSKKSSAAVPGVRERDITKLSVQFVLGAAAHGEHRFARFRRAFGDASANIASRPGVRSLCARGRRGRPAANYGDDFGLGEDHDPVIRNNRGSG